MLYLSRIYVFLLKLTIEWCFQISLACWYQHVSLVGLAPLSHSGCIDSHLSLTSCAAATTEATLLVSICSRATWAVGWEARRAERAAWARCMFLQARQSCRPSVSCDRRRSHSARPRSLQGGTQEVYVEHCVAMMLIYTSKPTFHTIFLLFIRGFATYLLWLTFPCVFFFHLLNSFNHHHVQLFK